MARGWNGSNAGRTSSLAAEAQAALDAAGQLADDEIDLAGTALQFGRLATPRADWQAARDHLSELAREAVALAAPRAEPRRQAVALADLLGQRFGYRGDDETYDDFANANLLRVIERRRGLPVALGILWLHAAQAAGWDAAGVNLPRHFVVQLRAPGAEAVVVDPFRGGAVLDASGLPAALLEPMRRREVLLRLQNNVRMRLMQGGDLAGAAACGRDMLRLAPHATHLWLETAAMHERLEEDGEARAAYARVLRLAPNGPEGEQARRALARLRPPAG